MKLERFYKLIVLFVLGIFFIFLFSPNEIMAQSCSGHVYDSITSQPINNAEVRINLSDLTCLNEPDVVQYTDSNGYWFTLNDTGFTCKIGSITYSAPGYFDIVIPNLSFAGCLMCDDMFCDWFGDDPSNVNLIPSGGTPSTGWTCADPNASVDDNRCPQISCDPQTQSNCYPTQTDCLNSCVLNLTPPPLQTPNPTPLPFEIVARPAIHPLCNSTGIYSAIGCIPLSSITEFDAFWLRWSLGVGGGISFLMIIYGGFLYLTSKGDVEKVQEAKGYLSAAVGGIFVLIFSVFILEIVGLRILQLPGF